MIHNTSYSRSAPCLTTGHPPQACVQPKEGIAGGLTDNSDSACWRPSKPTLYGVQICCCCKGYYEIYCCCKGYYGQVRQMQVYTGLNGPETNHGENVVKRLTQDFWRWAKSLIWTASSAAWAFLTIWGSMTRYHGSQNCYCQQNWSTTKLVQHRRNWNSIRENLPFRDAETSVWG